MICAICKYKIQYTESHTQIDRQTHTSPLNIIQILKLEPNSNIWTSEYNPYAMKWTRVRMDKNGDPKSRSNCWDWRGHFLKHNLLDGTSANQKHKQHHNHKTKCHAS